MIKVLLFDWGDTLMRDFPEYKGPMANWPKVETLPGVRDVLTQLSSRYVCCVATNAGSSGAKQVAFALVRGEIAPYIQRIFTPAELKTRKPSLLFYKKIIEQLKVKPRECVMIGNSLVNDVLAARKAGIEAVWYHTKGKKSGFNRKGGYWMIQNMEDLPEAISRIEKAAP